MCMTFKLPVAKDGTVVAARSMEFPMGMPTQLAVLPADHAGTGSVGDGGHPKTWKATHGVVGMGVFGHADWLVDGINTAGVSAHLLYMPGGYCSFRKPKGDGSDLSQLDLATGSLNVMHMCLSLSYLLAGPGAVAPVSLVRYWVASAVSSPWRRRPTRRRRRSAKSPRSRTAARRRRSRRRGSARRR